MIVVSDTSPITALLHVGRIDILHSIFGPVIIPPAVHAELLRGHDILPDFISVRTPMDIHAVRKLLDQLDPGEAEAIILAREISADLLLIDEKQGRKVALLTGIRVMGVLGVIGLAKSRGLIPSITDMLNRLTQDAGFRFDKTLRERVLREFGD